MALQVETKDCTALTDADLAEMADVCAGSGSSLEIGQVSKAKEDWVLSTTARIEDKLHGFMFSTLERIGGTPCVLLGLVSIKRTSRRDTVLKGVMHEAFHRALMAFPDEDVLVGSRLVSAGGFEAFRSLSDIVPRPGHRPVGEERAWGRRLAKRFGVDSHYDEKSFQVKNQPSGSGFFDHDTLKPESLDEQVVALFKGARQSKGDCLVAYGWAMAEDLVKLGAS